MLELFVQCQKEMTFLNFKHWKTSLSNNTVALNAACLDTEASPCKPFILDVAVHHGSGFPDPWCLEISTPEYVLLHAKTYFHHVGFVPKIIYLDMTHLLSWKFTLVIVNDYKFEHFITNLCLLYVCVYFTWYLSRLILGFLFNCSPFFYVVFYLTETSAYCDILIY